MAAAVSRPTRLCNFMLPPRGGKAFKLFFWAVCDYISGLMCSHVRGFFILGAILAAFANANAAELKEARVTQIVRDVKLLPNAAPARPAVVNDPVRDGTAVRTGVESRTELTFSDATLARLGANTIFSFTEGTRNLELTDGAMLLRVPKNAGGAKINTAAVTAAITGTRNSMAPSVSSRFRVPSVKLKMVLAPSRARVASENVSSVRDSTPVSTAVPSRTGSFTTAGRAGAAFGSNFTSRTI